MERGAGRSALGAGEKRKVTDFRDLVVWRKGREIARAVYEQTRAFPSDELFGLTNQMRRSAVSITSNIAEGFNRRGSREFHRFVSVALGSCGELRSLILIAEDQNFLAADMARLLEEQVTKEERMLGALQRSLAQRPAPSA